MKLFRESLIDKARRVLGGADTRPPAAWPFPTWKGQALAEPSAEGPPMPKRRGRKPAAVNHPTEGQS